jgi:microcystin-dependent protein
MSEPFLAEIRIMSFHFAPKGWALCNGQLLPINQNQALFALLGTNYGGDGRVNFALPNLQGRTPIHVSPNHAVGQAGGEQFHTLAANEMPAHKHGLMALTSNAAVGSPAGNLPAHAHDECFAAAAEATAVAAPNAVANSGGSQAHENRQPFLTLNFCIALQGIFPSRND